jgi:two-component system chemotaxis sensor kinase CheA
MPTRRRTPKQSSKADQEFVSEAEEILEQMREGLADLADARANGSETDPDRVNAVFRSAHSLKALAGMFGFAPIHDLAHRLEDILDGLRLGRVAIEGPALDLIDEAVRIFATQLEQVCDDEAMSRSGVAIEELNAKIQQVLEGAAAPVGEFGALDLDASLLRALTEYEEHRLRESIRRGRHILLVDATFEIISFEEGLQQISTTIRESGEVLSTLPAPGEAPASQIRFSLLAATDISAEEFAPRLPGGDVSVRLVSAPEGSVPVTSKPRAPGSASTEDGDEVSAAATERGAMESLRSISDTVRVDIRKLDELMNLVGELVIQRGAISDLIARLVSQSGTARLGNDLAKVHKAIDRKLRELQSAVLDVRMVPLRQVFEKLSRVVRRLRRDQDKNVSMDFRGADTELDKLIVEQLVDPLMHVVRNAFDHAIESPADRRAAGKPEDATIFVRAFQRGNHVVIEVRDDGGGIDRAKVRAIAESQGLVSPDDELTERETLDLIFLPGLSTRGEISETSGRGVGMDVVRANLAALGGMVEVNSVVGRGTTVSMTLPITLAIIQALIVGVAEHRFAIPLNSVLETLLLEGHEIQRSEDREILNLRGDALTLRRLSEEFELSGTRNDGKQYAVVLGMGEQRVGLLVDDLHGQQDTVIKSIKGPIREIAGIAGATELGDQGVVLVIDVSYIVDESTRRMEAA